MSDTATQTESQAAEGRLDLHLDANEVKGELATISSGAVEVRPDGDPEMERKAQDLVDKLIGFAAGNHDEHKRLSGRTAHCRIPGHGCRYCPHRQHPGQRAHPRTPYA